MQANKLKIIKYFYFIILFIDNVNNFNKYFLFVFILNLLLYRLMKGILWGIN